MKNIILYGMRGTGKSTIGKKLAKKINLTFFDLDKYIEENIGCDLYNFIQNNGWEAFREKEYFYLKKILLENENIILSLGGGTIYFQRNQEILKNSKNLLVYIESSIENIERRIKNQQKLSNKRNSITGKDLIVELKEVYNQRKDIYEKNAEITIINNDKIEKSVNVLFNKLFESKKKYLKCDEI